MKLALSSSFLYCWGILAMHAFVSRGPFRYNSRSRCWNDLVVSISNWCKTENPSDRSVRSLCNDPLFVSCSSVTLTGDVTLLWTPLFFLSSAPRQCHSLHHLDHVALRWDVQRAHHYDSSFVCCCIIHVPGQFSEGCLYKGSVPLFRHGCLVLLQEVSLFSPVHGVDTTAWSSVCSTVDCVFAAGCWQRVKGCILNRVENVLTLLFPIPFVLRNMGCHQRNPRLLSSSRVWSSSSPKPLSLWSISWRQLIEVRFTVHPIHLTVVKCSSLKHTRSLFPHRLL